MNRLEVALSTLCVHFFSPLVQTGNILILLQQHPLSIMPDCLQELSSRCQASLLVLIICIFFIFPTASASLKFLSGKNKNKHRHKKPHHHHPKAEHHSSWVVDLAKTENTEGKSAFKQTAPNNWGETVHRSNSCTCLKQTQISLNYSDMGFEVFSQREPASTQSGSETTLNEVYGDRCHFALCSRPAVWNRGNKGWSKRGCAAPR